MDGAAGPEHREVIKKELSKSDALVALDLVEYLRCQEVEFIRDRGYWRDKLYFVVQFQGQYVCFIAIKDPEVPENRWTVWSDDMTSDLLADNAVFDESKEIEWSYVDLCGHCGACGGGRTKTIFGK